MNKLIEGKIPANTVCPFKAECPSSQNFQCGHLGVDHAVQFSCGYARLFQIFSSHSSERPALKNEGYTQGIQD